MKNKWLSILCAFGITSFVIQGTSCKSKGSETKTDTAVTITAPTDNTVTKPADTAVIISPDDALKTSLTDATKDFPGVTASVDQGVVTLTGNITRDKLPKLMQSVNALHPKKITNNLTIK